MAKDNVAASLTFLSRWWLKVMLTKKGAGVPFLGGLGPGVAMSVTRPLGTALRGQPMPQQAAGLRRRPTRFERSMPDHSIT
jgi:hypothetical protein